MLRDLLGSGISSTPRGHLVDGLDQVAVDAMSYHCLHHGQVLEIVVGLEQSIASEELDEDASDTPNITGIRPSETQNDLWGSVVASRDN